MPDRSAEERDRAWDSFREIVDRIGQEVQEARSKPAPLQAQTQSQTVKPYKAPDKTGVKTPAKSIPARTLAKQLFDLKLERGVLKKDIATYMGISPSHLSQLISSSLPLERMEQIADAAGVAPYYSDEYVAKVAGKLLLQDAALLAITRKYLFEMTPIERSQFISLNSGDNHTKIN